MYLHFGDRAGLLLALLAWVDQAFNLGDLLARVNEAQTGAEALERMIEVHAAAYSPRIDALTRILEAHQDQDPAVSAALRDRLEFRRAAHRAVIARLATETGDLGTADPRRSRRGPRRRIGDRPRFGVRQTAWLCDATLGGNIRSCRE